MPDTKIFRSLIKKVSYRLGPNYYIGVRTLKVPIRRAFWKMVAAASLVLVSGLFEGGSLTIFAAAVEILATDDSRILEEFEKLVGGVSVEFLDEMSTREVFAVLLTLGVLFQIGKSSTTYAGLVLATLIKFSLRADLADLATRQIVRLKFEEISKYPIGKLSTKVGATGAAAGLATTVYQGFSSLVMIVVYVVLMLVVSPTLTVIAIVGGLIYSRLLIAVGKKLRGLGGDALRSRVKHSQLKLEYLYLARLIRVFDIGGYVEQRVKKHRDMLLSSLQRQNIIKDALPPFTDILTICMVALVLLSGMLVLGDAGSQRIGGLFVFVAALYRLIPTVNTLNQKFVQLMATSPTLDTFGELMRSTPDRFPTPGSKIARDLTNEICFEGVSFRYKTNQTDTTLRDISFCVKRGSTVGIIGASGAGKSTIVDLIMGLQEPDKGKIVVDGEDLREIDRKSWLDLIGYVDQEVALINDSVRKNIDLGQSTRSLSQVEDAAKIANAHEFITKLPDAYESLLGDRGFGLSGGQRQRIAIARAIVRNPKILIIDEGTSSLDSESEKLIHEALRKVRGQCTTIIVAHRLSTILDSDLILVIDNGEIVERGTPERLLQENSRFSELMVAQTKATKF